MTIRIKLYRRGTWTLHAINFSFEDEIQPKSKHSHCSSSHQVVSIVEQEPAFLLFI